MRCDRGTIQTQCFPGLKRALVQDTIPDKAEALPPVPDRVLRQPDNLYRMVGLLSFGINIIAVRPISEGAG